MPEDDLKAWDRLERDEVYGVVIRGTLVRVDEIMRHVRNGETCDTILQAYPGLKREDVREALLYSVEF